MSEHIHDDQCAHVFAQVHAFFHHELTEAEMDAIREHLNNCDGCLDNYDVEQAITALVRRCSPPQSASESLRMRITSMTMTWSEDAQQA